MNTGHNSEFQPVSLAALPSSSMKLRAADLNGDGRKDLIGFALSSFASNTTSFEVFINLGGGQFSRHQYSFDGLIDNLQVGSILAANEVRLFMTSGATLFLGKLTSSGITASSYRTAAQLSKSRMA